MFVLPVEDDAREEDQARTGIELLRAITQFFARERIECVFFDGIENVAHLQ